MMYGVSKNSLWVDCYETLKVYIVRCMTYVLKFENFQNLNLFASYLMFIW